MKTEDLNLEYGILYSLMIFKKEALSILQGIDFRKEYFANLYHKEFYEDVVKIIKENKKLSTDALLKIYQSKIKLNSNVTKIKLKSLISEIKQNKIKLIDIVPYVKQLKRFYVTRKLLKTITEQIESEKDIEDVCNIINDKTNYYLSLIEDNDAYKMSLKQDLDKRIDYVKDIYDNPDKMGLIETGLHNIDKKIGKQHRGEYVLYEARTNVGKSIMLMGTAVHNFKKGRKVVIITIEMSAYQYLFRIDSHLTGFLHDEFTRGKISKNDKKISIWKDTINNTGLGDLLVYWVPENCTPAKVHAILSNLPFKPDLVIVDYVGDMSANLRGIDNLDPKAQGHCHTKLKAMAGEFNCVIYSAQQTKRGVKKIDSESGANTDIGIRKADLAMGIYCTKEDELFIYEENGKEYKGRLTISVFKGRNVPKCHTKIIPNFEKMNWIEQEEYEDEELINDENNNTNTNNINNDNDDVKDEEELDVTDILNL